MRAGSAIPLVLCLAAGCRCSDPVPTPPAQPPCFEDSIQHPGEATFYDATGGGSCSFEPSPDDLLVAAIGKADNPGATACGACLDVAGPAGSVIVRVVDGCPGCDPGDLDLSRTAFARVAEARTGRVPIVWRHVACPVDGPLRYRFKDGSNPFWTGVQIRNHRYAITRLEVRGKDGAYREVPRAAYNYFVDRTGMGIGPYAFRLTDARQQVIEEASIALTEGREVVGTAQLARCHAALAPLAPPADH